MAANIKNIMFSLIALILINASIKAQNHEQSYIRANMLGYLSDDQKIAIIGSSENLDGSPFNLLDDKDRVVFTGTISADRGNKNTPFKFNFAADFSDVTKYGKYRIKLSDGTISNLIAIGSLDEYMTASSLLLEFFHSQRCGNINPILHNPCHLNDEKAALDVSGGWHDAGDYIKYMITITFTTVEMLTAADYAYSFGFENAMADIAPQNNIPDLLEEAKVGLDWILKMTADCENGNYYYQVSGEEDHQGWRLPEEDDSTRDAGKSRSLHKGWGGNLLGRSAASLVIASRIYSKFDPDYAKKCLERAELLFADHEKYKNAQPAIPAHFYNEREWLDDMVLGASELYKTTGKSEYLNYAETNVVKLKGDDIGWNGTDYLAYASCFKSDIAKDYCGNKMKLILSGLKSRSEKEVYFLSSDYAWGTTAMFTADAQKAIMYYYLTSDKSYLNLATAQRDYLLGRNNWGVSFMIGVGSVFPLNAHSQLNSLAGLHKGAVVGGPAVKNSWERIFPNINIENDKYAEYQSNIIYYDIQKDYYCNEVALDYTVPSVFIFIHNIAQANKNIGSN